MLYSRCSILDIEKGFYGFQNNEIGMGFVTGFWFDVESHFCLVKHLNLTFTHTLSQSTEPNKKVMLQTNV